MPHLVQILDIKVSLSAREQQRRQGEQRHASQQHKAATGTRVMIGFCLTSDPFQDTTALNRKLDTKSRHKGVVYATVAV